MNLHVVSVVVNRSEIAEMIDLPEVIEHLYAAMRAHSPGQRDASRMPVQVPSGAFHIVGGSAEVDGRLVMSVKTNARLDSGVTGVVLLFDADQGDLLAIMDSARITQLRTAALTAVAIEATVHGDAHSVALLGAGRQAQFQLAALERSGRCHHVRVWDIDAGAAERLATITQISGLTIEVAATAESAVRSASLVVSITPARAPLFAADDVQPGTTLIALGADAAGKQELDPDLLSAARVITDDRRQCAQFGELQHALARGDLVDPSSTVELLDVVSGAVPARLQANDIVVVDSTGTALQDAVAAWLVYRRAREWTGVHHLSLDR